MLVRLLVSRLRYFYLISGGREKNLINASEILCDFKAPNY